MSTRSAEWQDLTVEAVVERLAELGVPTTAAYWCSKPPLKDIFFYGTETALRTTDREHVARLFTGELQTYPEFPWVNLGVPPPWDGDGGVADPTWDFYRHCLRWTEPLLRVWLVDASLPCLELWLHVVADWCKHNFPAPGATKFAWFDHAGANRLRLLCWAWEHYRQHAAFDERTAAELLGLIYIHARFMSDPATYPGHSNHGLEMTGALLSAAVTVSEFREASGWLDLALNRFLAYVAQNFSAEGFHLEQSPFYHFYVLDRLSRTVSFLDSTGVTLPDEVIEALRRIEQASAYLCKPDGLLPTVGDTPSMKPTYQRLPMRAADARNFRFERSIVSHRAGYAIFRGFEGAKPGPEETDAYLLFKCNTFWSPHFHHDALSLVFYAFGRDWLIDAGQLNYDEKSTERQYVRSARAHSALIIDNKPFGIRPVTLLAHGQDGEYGWVVAEHALEQGNHRRSIELHDRSQLVITDDVSFNDSQEHSIEQQFLTATDLDVSLLTDGRTELRASTGHRCLIERDGDIGQLTVIRGQREPHMLGWYAPSYGKLLPASMLVHTLRATRVHARIVTRFTFSDAV